MSVLRALADDTRLRALRLIAERPRSTQELAPLVGVTEAALSKQLRALADAGPLECQRDGYYVLYRLAPILLATGALNLTLLAIGVALLALIGAPFSPARNALVPQIAPPERLLEANGLLQVSFRAAFFVGPLLLAPLLAGFAALRAEPDVLIVVLTFVLALVAASGFLTVGVVALVGDGFGGGNGQYGLLLGIAGVAEVFGALVVARLRMRDLAITAVLAWALLGAFRFPLGLAGTPAVAAALLATGGTISLVGVRNAFMVSGAALITIATVTITRLRVSQPLRRRPHDPCTSD